MKVTQHISPEHTGTNINIAISFFQPKLSINAPGDFYEQQADKMADKVMRMKIRQKTDTFFSPAFSSVQRKCAYCEEEDKKAHRKESNGGEITGSNELDTYVSTLSSSGQHLSESSRQFFEPRFGQDFSNVKVHTDSVAAKSAQSINALAYTTGNNIVFNQGQYSPDSDSGQRLMAHELTHVVQQGASVQTKNIQRQNTSPKSKTQEHGDLNQIPPSVIASCSIAGFSLPEEQKLNYATDKFSLNAQTKATLDQFAKDWNDKGANENVRIDGYASMTGPEAHNWELSCERANSVISELISPSNGTKGIPVSFLSMYAHGATNRFSQSDPLPNQTATIVSEIKVKPPPPKKDPPEPKKDPPLICNYTRNKDVGVNFFNYCPDTNTDVDDAKVRALIDDALAKNNGNFEKARRTLQFEKERDDKCNCCDYNITAAEHYLLIRDNPLIDLLTIPHIIVKGIGIMPAAGYCPVSRTSLGVAKWEQIALLEAKATPQFNCFKTCDELTGFAKGQCIANCTPIPRRGF